MTWSFINVFGTHPLAHFRIASTPWGMALKGSTAFKSFFKKIKMMAFKEVKGNQKPSPKKITWDHE